MNAATHCLAFWKRGAWERMSSPMVRCRHGLCSSADGAPNEVGDSRRVVGKVSDNR